MERKWKLFFSSSCFFVKMSSLISFLCGAPTCLGVKSTASSSLLCEGSTDMNCPSPSYAQTLLLSGTINIMIIITLKSSYINLHNVAISKSPVKNSKNKEGFYTTHIQLFSSLIFKKMDWMLGIFTEIWALTST